MGIKSKRRFMIGLQNWVMVSASRARAFVS
jgi:hypothetical protein